MLRKMVNGLTLALAACATSGTPEVVPDAVEGPIIRSIEPTSGLAGADYPIEVVLSGQGFAERGNVVNFGGIPVVDLPSTQGGTRIVFMAPKQNPSRGGAAPMVLLPGRYPVTVTVSGLTSVSVDFELVRGELNFE